jgi:uncharacterized damage-inducible protein DinB
MSATAVTLSPGWAAMMAAYNAEMNRRLYDAAGRLDEAQRRAPRGAFWGSIHGTLNHLLWGDMQWLARFDGGEKPPVALSGSPAMLEDFAAMRALRTALDARIDRWVATLTPGFLAGDFSWYSGAAKRDVTRPAALVVTHFFNHQTHHRGQVHAMLTAAGEATGDTDLFLVLA